MCDCDVKIYVYYYSFIHSYVWLHSDVLSLCPKYDSFLLLKSIAVFSWLACGCIINKNLCGRDGCTICGSQCVPKSTDALSACRKVHVCHCNSLGGATWRSVTITGRTDRRTDRQTDGQTDRVRRNMRPPPREEGRIIMNKRYSDSTITAR